MKITDAHIGQVVYQKLPWGIPLQASIEQIYPETNEVLLCRNVPHVGERYRKVPVSILLTHDEFSNR